MHESGETLGELLTLACRTKLPLQPPAEVPTIGQAYAIQREVARLADLPVTVWKLALTSSGARDAFGAAEPVVGRLPASAILNAGTHAGQYWAEMYAEAELVFLLGEDLPPQETPYTRETVLPAIKAIHGGIELAASRYDTTAVPLGLFIADNAMGHAVVAGHCLSTSWEDRFDAMPVHILVDGQVAEEGATSHVMGSPLDALVWLANWLCDNGEGGLRKGQLVTSGSCTRPTPVKAGDAVVASFGGIDAARVTLIPLFDREN